MALSHRPEPSEHDVNAGPHAWVRWSCGQEDALDSTLRDLDLLVLNHGINPGGDQCPDSLSLAIEVNAMSHWRLMQRFEQWHNRLENVTRIDMCSGDHTSRSMIPSIRSGLMIQTRCKANLKKRTTCDGPRLKL